MGGKNYRLDVHIFEAITNWIDHGLDPGSCTRLLLAGKYDEAKLHAHPLILPVWDDHVAFVESLPKECRGENMRTWQEQFRTPED